MLFFWLNYQAAHLSYSISSACSAGLSSGGLESKTTERKKREIEKIKTKNKGN
jgi:hypothetical protein